MHGIKSNYYESQPQSSLLTLMEVEIYHFFKIHLLKNLKRLLSYELMQPRGENTCVITVIKIKLWNQQYEFLSQSDFTTAQLIQDKGCM